FCVSGLSFFCTTLLNSSCTTSLQNLSSGELFKKLSGSPGEPSFPRAEHRYTGGAVPAVNVSRQPLVSIRTNCIQGNAKPPSVIFATSRLKPALGEHEPLPVAAVDLCRYLVTNGS